MSKGWENRGGKEKEKGEEEEEEEMEKGEVEEGERGCKGRTVAKALHGQRFPMPPY